MYYLLIFVPILLFVLYVGLETLKQNIYFFPNTHCDHYDHTYKNIFIETDKYNIHGWLYDSQEKDKIVIFFHGNAGNIGNRLNIMKQWQDAGYSILLFDYPGYGLSKGRPSEQSLYESSEEVLKYILKTKKKKDIVLYGESIGCSVASHVAVKFNINYLILQSGFISIKEVGKDFLPDYLHWFLHIIKDFNTYDILSKYNGKLMILHSKDDEIISFRHAESLKDFSTEFYEIHGNHNNPQFDFLKITNFIEKN